MSETEHEDTGEAAETAADVTGPSDDDTAEAEAEEAETGAGEAGEASQAESEHDAGDGDETADDDGDEPAQPGTQASAKAERDQQKLIDKMFDAAEREAKRHTTRVAEIAGDAAPDLLQCPLCMPDEGQPLFAGWLLPVKPSEEKIASVRQAIGLAPKIDYREDPHSKVCPSCGGLKSVVPAGAEATSLVLPCADCKANGWIATDAVRGGVTDNGEVPTLVAVTSSAPPTLEPDSPEIADLKARGYTVIAPYSAGS